MKIISHKKLAEICDKSYASKSLVVNEVELLIEDLGEFIVIAFRGTEATDMWKKGGVWDVIRDLRFWPVGYYGMRGHAGFLRGCKAVEEKLIMKLAGMERKPIVVTGHSLGGGLAIPCAAMLKEVGFEVTSLVTFGCPRCISKGFEKFEGLTIHQYEYGDDVVPTYQWWTARKHLNRISVGKPRSKNWFSKRTWDDHAIELYVESL